MRYVLTALLTMSALAVLPARSQETEPGTSLAFLERNTALIKEDEFETPETIAIIEKNREDRERTVVMDR